METIKKTPKKSSYKHKFNVGDVVRVTSEYSPLYGEVCRVMMRFQSGSYSLQIVGTRIRCTGFGRWMEHVPNPEDYPET